MGNLTTYTPYLALILLAAIPAAKASAQDSSNGNGPLKIESTWIAPTLKEPIAPDIVADKVWDGRGMAPFKSIDNPPMVKAADADFLTDGDYILGVTVNGESRAYPTRFIWFHHAVNDTFGKPGAAETHVAITYCSVCNTGIRYDPVVNGKLIMFDFFGLYNGIVALCDRETESVILQGEGRVINGPLMGTIFKTGPLLDTTWGEWVKLHPDTVVMSPETPFKRFYSPKDRPEPRGYDSFPAPYFRPTVTRGDLRLPPFDKVLAVTLAGEPGDAEAERRAYPIKALIASGGVINESLGKTHVAVFYDSHAAAAVALSAKLGRRVLSFELRAADGKTGFFDRETGTRWSIEGLGEAGPLKGKSLERLNCHLSQWYGWSAYFPDTTIYGSTAPPCARRPVCTSLRANLDSYLRSSVNRYFCEQPLAPKGRNSIAPTAASSLSFGAAESNPGLASPGSGADHVNPHPSGASGAGWVGT